jgi:spore germination cell wall hydrolase CwlJ-like protein
MMLGVLVEEKKPRGPRGRGRWALAGLMLSSASCVPVSASQGPAAASSALAAAPAAPAAAPATAPVLPALIAPAAAEAPLAYAGRTELDRLRSHDCLAQAIYYEAGQESEDGQRAVAQVVLNRVRHPAWPDSICGVVYQGPMRAGGGCQFTFTCDGSLMRRPTGEAWARARRLAAEALAGYVHRRVALATHYHANYVFPAWAPRLRTTAVIGAHLFYRLPGAFGEAGAFTDAYTGVEPFPQPSFNMLRRPGRSAGLAPLTTANRAAFSPPSESGLSAAPVPAPAPDPAEAMVREEYRQSGQWRDDAPPGISGR